MWTINLEPDAPRTRLVLSPCPYCQEQFGTASLPIHVKRCRALYVAPTPEVPEVVPTKARSIPSLQAMCTQMILGNLHITCFSGLFTQPAHQAALIASLPETILQQIFMHIVYEHQNRTKRYEKHKAKLRLVKDNCAALEATCAQVHGLRKEVDRLQRVIEARDAQHAKTRTAASELRAEVQRLQQENSRLAKVNQQQQVQLQVRTFAFKTLRLHLMHE
ncbi:hypothetical protein SPRG_19777 [Saprolegnia parasitica CBS 223.65]|uniref:Uncharacterized protein n=1 Tax=Saprolegnia parasitica (strain CBS 223.65) TaxID=695850 RepID=A0A067CIA7_SAPPC|nr:hypothetical protein SPRG_19777 [Saprolegnia parasitica CBS 223.65]KDO30218.1 hypothetical protein SPRG_19777 [Saprolegnia parasitica CBS 223.65]|eukprot:XP_012199030.1 hypothetical protein SPRG_19777 [Saprolegnia parasitica CBS 223.65]